MTDRRPIGVFDSGVGGLTVLRAIQDELPSETTVYLGDLARCPYGTRPQIEVRMFAEQICDRLLVENVKLLAVACNTATAAAFPGLIERYEVPVVGVIEPAVREALATTRTGRIGVVATNGTVLSGAYRRAVQAHAPMVTVVERSASWLVPMIERGRLAQSLVSRDLRGVVSDFRAADVDVLILGCTHFPLVRDIFESEVGPDVTVIDSAGTTAREVARIVGGRGLASDSAGRHRWLVTGPAEEFAERAQTMFRSSPSIETIDLASLSLTP